MTIEEKAEAYDEALKRARDVYTYYCDDREQLRKIESIFPELKESKDERIIKALINGFKNYKGWDIEWFNGITVREAIAWLEKQGEQKPTWSEDDIKMFVNIKACLCNSKKDYSREINWLKTLKDRIQPKQEWSEEDEMMIKFTLTHFRKMGATEDSDIINWLKSLKSNLSVSR